jgi:hypothetical protein
MINLDAVICRLGKISNNLEKHGDEDVTEFNIPVTGIMLSAEQLNAFIGDPHCDRSWFNTKGSIREPMPWWSRGNFRLKDKFEANVCAIKVSGDRELAFEPEKDLPACGIGKIRLKPQVGGFTEMSFQLQLRPGIGKENLLLQEHQNREVRLTVSESRVAQNRGKQQDLPLDGQPSNGAGRQASGGFKPTVDGPAQDKRMRARTAAKRAKRPAAH